jgi:hypothetical protein
MGNKEMNMYERERNKNENLMVEKETQWRKMQN